MAEGSKRSRTTTKKVTIEEANKKAKEQKFKQKKFVHKVRAVFRSSSKSPSTFRFLPAMKGLQEQLFATRQGAAIVNSDQTKGYSTNDKFPKENSIKDFYQIDHGEKDRGQTNVVVVFKVACDYRVGELKRQGLMKYLNENNIYINSHKFKTVKVKKIGFITHIHPTFTNFDEYQTEAKSTIKQFLDNVDIDDEEIDEDVRKFAEN